MNKRPIGIDLFAGAGGLSLGFEQAGFDIAAAIEIDPIHAAVHHFNFPNTPVLARSIVGISGEEIRSLAGIGNSSIDVVFGGPPCQGFSMIGQRMLDDPRNHLVREFVRLVVELEAKAFVFENVKGLTLGKHRQFLDNLITTFEDAGYNVRLPWKVLNAKDYGVPQHRERLFLLGTRKGVDAPFYPSPICQQENGCQQSKTRTSSPVCYDAISDIPDAELFPELLESDSVDIPEWGTRSNYAKVCRCESLESWFFGYRREWDRSLLTSSMRTDHSQLSRKRFASTATGQVEPISRFFKLDPEGICNTLRAGTDSARGAFTSPRPIHFAYPRCITVREMARLHGYPDWFRFHVTKWHGARQVGNSVPPPLGREIAFQVIKSLGRSPSERPQKKLNLGPSSLLSMDMSEAAHFWKVSVPIGRRDKKSGQMKRKQSTIEMVSALGKL